MTTHPADARPSCMVAALDTIRAAQKLKLEPGTKNRVREQLPELYWSLMAEAAIYAELARADVNVGLVAGEHLVQRDERIREQKRMFADRAAQRHPHRAAADAMHKPNPTGSTEAGPGVPTFVNSAGAPIAAVGMRVRVAHGDYAGRRGTITQVYRNNEPPVIDVALDPLRDAREAPKIVSVLPSQFELDGEGLF